MSPTFQNVKAALHTTAHVKEQRLFMVACKQKTLSRILALTILTVGVLYLLQMNMLATRGYVMKDLEKQIALIKKENDTLRIRILQAQGMEVLQKKIDTLGFVRSDHIQYVAQQDAGLAAR